MTCIVGIVDKKKNSVIIGSDSFWGNIHAKNKIGDKKVFIRDNMIFGCCGSCRMISILKYKFKIPKIQENQDVLEYMHTCFIDSIRKCFKDCGFMKIENNIEEIDSSFLIGFRNELFVVESDLQVSRRHGNYNAIGAGEHYALAAMCLQESMNNSLKEKIEKALRVAEELSPLVSEPFDILELKCN